MKTAHTIVLHSADDMIPSDLDLYIGTINGYNNLIVIANDEISEIQLGYNNKVNEEQLNPQATFDSPKDDFDTPINEIPPIVDSLQDDAPINEIPPIVDIPTPIDAINDENKLTHDENKLMLILGGTILGSAIWVLK